MPLPPYPEFDEVLKALLDDIAPFVTFIEPNEPVPYLFGERVGGREDGFIDNPIVNVEIVAATRAESKQLKKLVSERIRQAGNTAPGGHLIDTAEEVTGSQYTPPFNPATRSVSATYRLSYRRARS